MRIEHVQWGLKAFSVHKKCMKKTKSVCNEDQEHLMCIESAQKGLRAHGNEIIERTKCEWKEMEDREQMKRDGSNIEKEEKVQRKNSSQHGTKHLLFKKNHQSLGSSHNVITYNTRTIAISF